jgi:hypothetical protein
LENFALFDTAVNPAKLVVRSGNRALSPASGSDELE